MTRRPHEDPVLNLIAEMRWHPRLWVWWSPLLLTMNAAVRRHPRLWAWWVPVFVVLNGVLGLWFVADYKNVPHRPCTNLGDGPTSPERARQCWAFVAQHSHGWLLSTDPDVIFLVAVVINALLIAVAVLRWRLYEAQEVHRLG